MSLTVTQALIATNQHRFRKIIELVAHHADRMAITVDTIFWVYDEYPNGHKVVFGGHDRVYIFKVDKDEVEIHDIQPVRGFAKNGSLIIDHS